MAKKTTKQTEVKQAPKAAAPKEKKEKAPRPEPRPTSADYLVGGFNKTRDKVLTYRPKDGSWFSKKGIDGDLLKDLTEGRAEFLADVFPGRLSAAINELEEIAAERDAKVAAKRAASEEKKAAKKAAKKPAAVEPAVTHDADGTKRVLGKKVSEPDLGGKKVAAASKKAPAKKAAAKKGAK